MTVATEPRLYYGRDDQVRIYHARWQEVVAHLGLGPHNVDLVLADPPYGINVETDRSGRYNPDKYQRERGITRQSTKVKTSMQAKTWAPIVGDNEAFDPAPWLAYRAVVLWGANHYADKLPASAAWWVWDKREGMTSNTGSDCELAWTNIGNSARMFHHMWSGYHRKSEVRNTLHPTQKPVTLMEWCLQRAKLEPGALVLVPYMGSGPEVRACLNLGYRVVAAEVEEQYCATAVKHRVLQEAMPLW